MKHPPTLHPHGPTTHPHPSLPPPTPTLSHPPTTLLLLPPPSLLPLPPPHTHHTNLPIRQLETVRAPRTTRCFTSRFNLSSGNLIPLHFVFQRDDASRAPHVHCKIPVRFPYVVHVLAGRCARPCVSAEGPDAAIVASSRDHGRALHWWKQWRCRRKYYECKLRRWYLRSE